MVLVPIQDVTRLFNSYGARANTRCNKAATYGAMVLVPIQYVTIKAATDTAMVLVPIQNVTRRLSKATSSRWKVNKEAYREFKNVECIARYVYIFILFLKYSHLNYQIICSLH